MYEYAKYSKIGMKLLLVFYKNDVFNLMSKKLKGFPRLSGTPYNLYKLPSQKLK